MHRTKESALVIVPGSPGSRSSSFMSSLTPSSSKPKWSHSPQFTSGRLSRSSLSCCWLLLCCRAGQLLLFSASLYQHRPIFTPRLLTTSSVSLSLTLTLSLQISSAQQLLLFLRLAAARLRLLHVSAWALALCTQSLYLRSLFPPSLHPPSSSPSHHYGDTEPELRQAHMEDKFISSECRMSWKSSGAESSVSGIFADVHKEIKKEQKTVRSFNSPHKRKLDF